MTNSNAHVPSPDLDLHDGTPVSTAFGDVYFSRAGGVAESAHVFLRGNGLPERWCSPIINNQCIALSASRCSRQGSAAFTAQKGQSPLPILKFTIGELGFGTGLNFLAAWRLFCETATAGAVLHYIAIEKYPFMVEPLHDVLALQPELAAQAGQFLAAYPLRLPGIHRIHLPRVVLTLCFGDVAPMLAEFTSAYSGERSTVYEPQSGVVSEVTGGKHPSGNRFIDAWFLDGFSPAKNPDMWTDAVLAQIEKLSAPKATIATFTVAGTVRRGLAAAGFTVRKIPGFGSKREMLTGVLEDVAGSVVPSPPQPCPYGGSGWSAAPLLPIFRLPSHIVILGAGIAGATLARALAGRGYTVTVLDRSTVAGGASGNMAGVLFPQLAKQWSDACAWYFTAYGFMLRRIAGWKAEGLNFASGTPGMLRLPNHAPQEAQLRAIHATLGLDKNIVHWLERDAASRQAGVTLPSGAAFFPQGTWISPPELCRALLQHDNINIREYAAAENIVRHGNGWAVTLAGGEVIAADSICVAAAHESANLLGDYGIMLHTVGGQVSEISAVDVAKNLHSILCHKGYVIPLGITPSVNSYLIGATYHREDMHTVTDKRHAENIAELNSILPGWFSGQPTAGRSSLRATTPDRLPYIGAVDDGLYVSTGHGSRGLLSAPLAAEMIASRIHGGMPPVSAALANAVRPMRFRKF